MTKKRKLSKTRSESLKRFWNSPKGKRQKKKYTKIFSEIWSTSKRRKQRSESVAAAWADESRRKKWIESITRVARTYARNAKKTKTIKKRYRDDPNYGADRISASLKGRPMSLPEEQVSDILRLIDLPYVYVGDGSLMIGRFCPDFVRSDAKILIEVFGHTHVRKDGKIKSFDKKRLSFIKKQGFQVLVVWQKELRHIGAIANKIRDFDNKALSRSMKKLPSMARPPLISVESRSKG